jgi:putative redox protein
MMSREHGRGCNRVPYRASKHLKFNTQPQRMDLMNEFIIDFPGGARVDAHFGPYTVKTDQPPSGGGQGSAPAPFSLFLASIGTCAGIYVLGFCRQRGLPTEGIRLVQRMEADPLTHMMGKISLEIQLPPEFPEKYKEAVIRSAEQCAVKKHLENPPKFAVTTSVAAN